MKLSKRLSRLFAHDKRGTVGFFIEQRKLLINSKEDFYKPNGGFVNTFTVLYNFLNEEIDLSLDNYDLITGIEMTSYTRNTIEFCALIDDCLMLPEDQFIARYKAIHEHFELDNRYLGNWFDNSDLVKNGLAKMSELCRYYQHIVCLDHNAENSHEIDNYTYLAISRYTTMMDRKYPGLITFIGSKDFVTLMNECINILIALLSVKIRGFGGEETN